MESEAGMGSVDVAAARGASKEPVIPSRLKKGENAAYGLPELSLRDVEIIPM